MSVVFEKARAADRAEIVDFANLVFSQASVPHDFKALLPKMYKDGAAFENEHYIAREDGRIMALVSALPYAMHVLDRAIQIAYVGTVSVNLYARGRGYMRALVKLMHEDMEARGAQLFVLGGRRQRYGYYGYTPGCPAVRHTVIRENVEKAFPDLDVSDVAFEELFEGDARIDEARALHEKRDVYCERPRYLDWMHSWQRRFYAATRGGRTIAFLTDSLADVEACDDADLPALAKAWILQKGGNAEISCALHEVERNRLLTSFAEHTRVENAELCRIVDYPAVTEALLRLRDQKIEKLEKGALRLDAGGRTLKIEVGDDISVRWTDEAPDTDNAQKRLLSVDSLFLPGKTLNYLPLPLFVPSADCY